MPILTQSQKDFIMERYGSTKCKFCKKILKNGFDYQNAIYIAKGLNPYVCGITCNKKLQKRRTLTANMRKKYL